MDLSRLSWRARQRLGQLARCVSERAFDVSDVELFLIYARQALPSGALHDFGNLIAHSIRTRGRMHDSVVAFANLTVDDFRKNHWKPYEDHGKASYPENLIEAELDDVLGAYGLERVGDDALHEFEQCLAVIGQGEEVEASDKDPTLVGRCELMLTDGLLSLDVVCMETLDTEDSFGNGLHRVVLNAPIDGFDGVKAQFGHHLAWLTRDGAGGPLRLHSEGTERLSLEPNEGGEKPDLLCLEEVWHG